MKTAWMFPGLEALLRPREFERALELEEVRARCAEACSIHDDAGLPEFLATLAQRPDRYDRDVARTAIAVLAIEVGLADRLRATLDPPDWVTGYSLGDAARTVCAGASSFADAVRIVGQVARRSSSVTAAGSCALVSTRSGAALDPDDAAWLSGLGLSISRLGGRHAHVAGGSASITALHDGAAARGWRSFPLFDFPVHASALDGATTELRRRLDDTPMRAPSIPTFSSTLGQPIDTVTGLRSELAGLLARTFDWHATVRTLAQEFGVRRIVHVGPGRTAAKLTRKASRDVDVLDAIDFV